MALGGNFNDELRLVGNVLQATGNSTPLDGGRIVSRHVAVQQPPSAAVDMQLIFGPTTSTAEQWETRLDIASIVKVGEKARVPIALPKFEEGDALATATETHLVPADPSSGATSAFVTFTWSELVTIKFSSEFVVIED